MEENKLSYEELSKLMDKISDAMKLSDKKQKAMDSKEEKLHKQTKVMLVEEGKQELENLKKEKEEFDEMTVNSLVYSKEQVLLIKEESEKQYQEKLLETMHKQKEIQTKLYSMKRRELSPEKLQQVEKSAQEADQKVKDDMKKFQTEHFKKMAKLDQYEKDIEEYAIKLGVEEKVRSVSISEPEPELEPEPVPAPEPELEVVSDSESEPELEVVSDSGSEPELEAVSESGAEPELEVVSVPGAEPEMALEPDSQLEPEQEPELESRPESIAQPILEPEPVSQAKRPPIQRTRSASETKQPPIRRTRPASEGHQQSNQGKNKIIIGRKAQVIIDGKKYKANKLSVLEGSRLTNEEKLITVLQNPLCAEYLESKSEEERKYIIQNLDGAVINSLEDIEKSNITKNGNNNEKIQLLMCQYVKGIERAKKGEKNEFALEYDIKDLARIGMLGRLTGVEVTEKEKLVIREYARKYERYGIAEQVGEYKRGFFSKIMGRITNERPRRLPTMADQQEVASIYNALIDENQTSKVRNGFAESLKIPATVIDKNGQSKVVRGQYYSVKNSRMKQKELRELDQTMPKRGSDEGRTASDDDDAR